MPITGVTRLKPAALPYPNGGALKAVVNAKVQRQKAEEAKKASKK
jgi:hypothetical protein